MSNLVRKNLLKNLISFFSHPNNEGIYTQCFTGIMLISSSPWEKKKTLAVFTKKNFQESFHIYEASHKKCHLNWKKNGKNHKCLIFKLYFPSQKRQFSSNFQIQAIFSLFFNAYIVVKIFYGILHIYLQRKLTASPFYIPLKNCARSRCPRLLRG